jgi:predicted transcriptional regulator
MGTKTNTAKVFDFTRKDERESEKKWGRAVLKLGYSMIPSLIFRAQARLGLSSTQLVLLLHLADYWWHRDHVPFPSKASLAERMGLSPRQIQRYLTELEQGGFITREERYATNKGQQSNGYNLTGLVEKLRRLEPEFREVKEHAKKQARNVSKPGGLAVHSPKKSGEQDE